MTARPKSELMREHRARLRAAGLVKVETWVQPEERERLAAYVEKRLGGFCPVGRQRTGASTAGLIELPEEGSAPEPASAPESPPEEPTPPLAT